MEVGRIAVVGAGLMGHGIALDFLRAGRAVVLCDVDAERLAEARQRIGETLGWLAARGLAPEEVGPLLARLETTLDLEAAVSSCDLVSESASERLPLKQELFRRMDAAAPATTILTSNTSTFMPTSLAQATRHPERVAVAHYFNPPYLVPLVELVAGAQTAPATIDRLEALYREMGKQPVRVARERLGFLGNRLQLALYREAMALVDEGVATPEDIDTVVRASFARRLPVLGIFGSMDAGGLDVFAAIALALFPDLSDAKGPSRGLSERVQEGHLGHKSGQGWYRYTPEQVAAVRRRLEEALVDGSRSKELLR